MVRDRVVSCYSIDELNGLFDKRIKIVDYSDVASVISIPILRVEERSHFIKQRHGGGEGPSDVYCLHLKPMFKDKYGCAKVTLAKDGKTIHVTLMKNKVIAKKEKFEGD